MWGAKQGPWETRVLRTMVAEGVRFVPGGDRPSGSQRRKNRGRRSRKQFCWCGFEKTARRGHLRCLVHTTGQMAPAVVDQPEETLPIVEHTPENEPVVPPDLEAQPYRVDVVIKERRQDSTPRTIVEVVENEYVTVVSKVSGRKSQIAWKNLKRYDIV